MFTNGIRRLLNITCVEINFLKNLNSFRWMREMVCAISAGAIALVIAALQLNIFVLVPHYLLKVISGLNFKIVR